MKSSDQVEHELKEKFALKDIKELRKLGLSNDELLTINIEEDEPFPDHKLGKLTQPNQLLSRQREYLDKINELFKAEQDEQKAKDDIMGNLMDDSSPGRKQEKWYFVEDPEDMEDWTDKKR